MTQNMKKILTLCVLVLVSCLTVLADSNEDMMARARQRFQNMKTLTAPVTQTRHNALLTADEVSKGTFYFKKPSSMCLKFNEGKDMLLMKNQQFTMVRDGKANTLNGKGNSQLEALKTLLSNFSAGQESEVALDDLADVDVERSGNTVTMTVVPRIADAKAKKKMMYQSFVVVLDTKAGELKSIRLNENGSNYTLYEFGKFTVDAPVSDSVFNL
jgi:outer membrane lipoprotein-sorting protein